MELVEERDAGVLVLIPAGRLDVAAGADLQLRIVQIVESGERRVVVDLGQASEVCGAAWRVLLMFGKRLAGLGGALAVCGLTEEMRRALALAGLEGALPVAAGRADAVAAVRVAEAAKGRTQRITELAARLLGAVPANSQRPPKKKGA